METGNKTAADYLDGTLRALVPVNVFDYPAGKIIKQVQPGNIVGTIYSWSMKDGYVWWNLNTGHYVKQVPNTFDLPYLEKSLAENKAARDSKIVEAVKERQEANDSTLYQAGKTLEKFNISGNLKILFAVAVLVVLVAVFYRISGK